MRSKAHIKSHPLHPMLIAFPIAFFTGAWIADLAAWLSGSQELWRIGYWLQPAGIISAVAAAIPGLMDFIYAVPPNSSGKKRAAKHGILNTTVVIIFTFSWLYRPFTDPSVVTVALDTVGFGLLSIAGWLGATLVYRNQIAVDHRYAHAGKWKEVYLKGDEKEFVVAYSEELKVNQMKLVHFGKKRIVIARTENGYAAFDDHCTHRGGGLSDGSLVCGTVQCPWHGSQFDVHSGDVKAGPAKQKINVYSTTETNGRIYLLVAPVLTGPGIKTPVSSTEKK